MSSKSTYPNRELTTKLYQHLSELFYALAKSDKVVRPEEQDQLYAIVRNTWQDFDSHKDVYGSDTTVQIISVFDCLNEGFTASEEWYDDFRIFYLNHPELFTAPLKELILRTCNLIAQAVNGTNKSELNFLLKVEILFNQ